MVAAGVLAMLWSSGAAARAEEPVRHVVELDDYGYTTTACGFDVVYSTDLRVTDLVWQNADGEVVRLLEQVHNSRQTWTNPANGLTLEGFGGGYTYSWNAPDDFGTFTGHTVTITVPGSGVVFQDAGRIVIEGQPPWSYTIPFAAGRHDFWFAQDRICAYLAG